MKANRTKSHVLLEKIVSSMYLVTCSFLNMLTESSCFYIFFTASITVLYVCGRRCSRSSSSMNMRRRKERKKLSLQLQTRLLWGTRKKRRINKPYSPLFSLYFVVCAVYILSFCLPISVGVKQEDHDALLTEVQRLEVELSKIRQDLQGVAGCKGRCEQLDTLQDTVSQILTFVWLCKTIKA